MVVISASNCITLMQVLSCKSTVENFVNWLYALQADGLKVKPSQVWNSLSAAGQRVHPVSRHVRKDSCYVWCVSPASCNALWSLPLLNTTGKRVFNHIFLIFICIDQAQDISIQRTQSSVCLHNFGSKILSWINWPLQCQCKQPAPSPDAFSSPILIFWKLGKKAQQGLVEKACG